MKKVLAQSEIPVGDLGPMVDVAGCWKFHEPVFFRYHVLFHHFILVEEGRVSAETPLGKFVAHAGDILCLRPAEWSQYVTVPNTTTYQAQIAFAAAPFDRATPVLPGFGLLPIHTRLGSRWDSVRRTFDLICHELPQNSLPSQMRWKAGVYHLLEEIAAAAIGETSEHEQDALERYRLLLTAVAGDSPTVAGFAREMGMSRQHFCRVFKQRFSVSPQTCRIAARLNEALRRLRTGKDSVKIIAHSLGFSGAKGLTRALQAHLGVTSSQARIHKDRLPELSQLMLDGFVLNRHVLPPGKSYEDLMARYEPLEKHPKS